MKRIILFLFALTFAGASIFAQNSKSQKGWNEYVGLYDPKVIDEFRDDNGEWWYYTLPTYATESAIYRYDIQSRTSKELCSGSVVAILPSGNLLIGQTGFDTDKNGQIIPGRRGFDCIISPEGKTLWKSNSYDL